MNNKGQALMEFVLILPICLILIFGIIEFGNMIYKKYQLESHMDTIIDIYKSDNQELLDNYEKTNDIDVKIDKSSKLVSIVATQKVKIITPGLSLVLDDPYTIKVDRKIYIENSVGVTINE